MNYQFLHKIESVYGPAFYILDPQQFIKNYIALLGEFRKYYSNTIIAYSYKTNYIPRLCQIIDSLGGAAEVVSSMELQLAKDIGVDYKRIYFNGPYKEKDAITLVLINGGYVNVDSLDELSLIIDIANVFPKKVLQIGIRCNFDVEDGVLSRFGFDVEDESFANAIEIIDNQPNLVLVGLHCHFASRTLSCWENRTTEMLNVIENFFSDRLNQLKYISLGGGIFSEMPITMKSQFDFYIPSFKDYATVSAKPFAEYIHNKNKSNVNPLLIIEPGTALVSNALKFVCKVYSIKEIRGKTIATLTGSIYNVNPTPNRKNVPIEIISSNKESHYVTNADFAGYTCIERDYLYRNYNGPLSVNDFVIFNEIGAYSVVMKPPFILPNFPIIEVSDSENIDLIKRGETFNDIFNSYTFKS